MKYAHILMAVASEIWAMQPEKMVAIIDFLATQAEGIKFSADEIEARIAPQTAKAIARKEGDIAIIPLRGVMANRMNLMGNISGGGGASAEQFSQQVLAAARDDAVKAIIIDTDSPGGAVLGADEAANAVMSIRGTKPIIAQVNATAASAAYWAISGADEIVVTPSGHVGSIGVYTVHEDISAALEKAGIKKDIISAGPFKAENNPFGPLGDEARAHMQSQVDAYHGMFVDRIASGRGVTSAVVRETFGGGRMVLASQAVSLRMADRIGTMEETLQRFGVGPQSESRRPMASERMRRSASL